jgi:HSP20 family protein
LIPEPPPANGSLQHIDLSKEAIMALVRWRSPSEDISRLERRMRRLFEEPWATGFLAEEMGWAPAVEVKETAEGIEVSAELPGISKEDVEVTLENNVLTIRGEKKEEKEEKEKERLLYERYYGSFQRSFTLPTLVDESKVRAEFQDGVLRIHLPKNGKPRGKKIEIAG